MAAMLIVLFQLFFGWCGGSEHLQALTEQQATSEL